MELQTILSILANALVAFCMYQMSRQDKAIEDLRTTLNALIGGQANTYAQKADLNRLSDALFARLDRIEDKLDKKADK